MWGFVGVRGKQGEDNYNDIFLFPVNIIRKIYLL